MPRRDRTKIRYQSSLRLLRHSLSDLKKKIFTIGGMRYVLVIIVFFMASLKVFAADKNVFVLCEKQRDVRWIRITSANDGKCRTIYSKEGFAQVVSSATFFSSCEAVLNNVKKNVEGGGFKCKEAVLANVVEIE